MRGKGKSMDKEKRIETGNQFNRKEDKDKKVKQRIFKIGALILLLIILILLLFKCSSDIDNTLPINDSPIKQGTINLPTKEEAQELVDKAVEQGMFQVFMNTGITVNSNNEANLLIQNSENNHYPAYVEIYNGDDLLYKSDTIKPGYKLEVDKLQKELDAGKYECNAYFHVLDNDSEINQIGLSVTITKES